jgi:malonyl-CoA O-methyltransferase
MTHHSHSTLDPVAAQRWQQWPATESPWLHEEVARRMQERLDWITLQPQTWLHWSPLTGGIKAHELLAKRYPNATCTIFETTERRADQVRQTLTPTPACCHPSAPNVITKVTNQVQMLWANMSLHGAAHPQHLLAQWHQALDVDGFLMFSCLGPDTLKALRTLYRQSGWPPPAHELTDMHDWGDRLLDAGFAEPVMDMEQITLSFKTPERLLEELRSLGRNMHCDRFSALRGKHWHKQWLEAVSQIPLQLNFEVVYGHAFKPATRQVAGLHEISLDTMRSMLTSSKTKDDN